ncbi:hypothetical protein, partial [Sutterella sp.]|uniref:hypothetical protein n=1 Tax=Sutterella sp. TaxID=1981025 RepID=UPI0026E06EA6
ILLYSPLADLFEMNLLNIRHNGTIRISHTIDRAELILLGIRDGAEVHFPQDYDFDRSKKYMNVHRRNYSQRGRAEYAREKKEAGEYEAFRVKQKRAESVAPVECVPDHELRRNAGCMQD